MPSQAEMRLFWVISGVNFELLTSGEGL